MSVSYPKSNNRAIIGKFQLPDLITDLCTGILMIFLFGPFFYAVKYGFTQGTYYECLIMIFPNFLALFKDLSLATVSPWLILGVALILGFVSRAVFIMYNILPFIKTIERLIARIAYWQIRKWHGLPPSWGYEKVVEELINRNPFYRVGETEYAKYRANLEDPRSQINKSKSYWNHEEFLFMRSSHFYGMFLTFSITYLFYGIIVSVLKGLQFPEFWLWIVIVILFLFLTICLLQEVIIHGVAFIEIDRFLYSQFSRKTIDQSGRK